VAADPGRLQKCAKIAALPRTSSQAAEWGPLA